jgi:2-alkyl-3-oxoalkanoate reductase
MARRRVAVVGANGFIGNRVVEMLHLGDRHDVRPIVRRASGLALASRFAIEGRVADARNEPEMTRALQGQDIVVHALAGDRPTILGTIAPVYRAAEKAGCRRLIYLSTAVVHGQAPGPDVDETSPLSRKQSIDYNVSKVRAEQQLFELHRSGKVEIVVLRPGIVYGPRSQWVGGLADTMLAGDAYLIDGGAGLFNGIYVDNLVDAIVRSFDADCDGQALLLGEDAAPSWREVYSRIASAIGLDIIDIPELGFEEQAPTFKERLDLIRQSPAVKSAMRALPRFLRDGLGAFWAASGAIPSGPLPGPSPTLEMALLHRSRHVPSWEKARRILGYAPPVDPEEAWRRTIAWLAFAGYPVPEPRHG